MNYMDIIDMQHSSKWYEVVTSFQQYDVYYLQNYVKAYMMHGDGIPYLIYYNSKHLRGINVVMKRDISEFGPLKSIIKSGSCYDLSTPYGYGGFIFEGDTSEKEMEQFYNSCFELANSQNVISMFTRFHPLLNNVEVMRSKSFIVDLGKTIAMDLESDEVIWSNFTPNNRNNIRKAERLGVKIVHGKSLDLLYRFMEIYNDTMKKEVANPYYFFEREFYQSIHTDLYDHYEVFYAVLEDKIISMAIMIFANHRMHCHFLGSIYEYRNYAPNNLLFYEAARWGCKQGFKTMHIGGGVGSSDDSLYRFKKSFNRNSDLVFSIGKRIYNQEIYDYLVDMRKKSDPTFDASSEFFPLYRARNY